jgi:CRP-like cAMP-binding protein
MFPEVYAKTDKGRDEVIQRRLGLTSRQRTLLIMFDGRKPCAALDGLMPPGQVAVIVGELLALDLIAPIGGPPSAPAIAIAIAASDTRLAGIKAEMVETAEACLGLLAAEVVRRIDSARDGAELLGVVGHWHMALQGSKRGREAALAHVERIRDSLRNHATD